MNLVQLLRRYPVTGGLCLLAIPASLANWNHRSIDLLVTDYHVWSGQIWRPLTSTLPHVNPIHLIFNLYWLWRFGTWIERVYGPWRTAALYAYLAFGSSLAEYDFGGLGIGLSGVVYGLFGFLWIAEQTDQRFRGAVDQQTVVLFVAWFFVCIALTVKDVMAVANFAHAGGMALGVLCAWAVTQRYCAKRPLLIALAGAALALFVALGTVARPYVNFTEFAGYDYGAMGDEAFRKGRKEDAVKYYRLALGRISIGSLWFNLGLANQRLGRWEEAAKAYETACRFNPDDREMRKVLAYAQRKAGHPGAADEDSPKPLEKGGEDSKAAHDDADEAPTHNETPRHLQPNKASGAAPAGSSAGRNKDATQ
jgi:membrane associated rhomboid family serine protease